MFDLERLYRHTTTFDPELLILVYDVPIKGRDVSATSGLVRVDHVWKHALHGIECRLTAVDLYGILYEAAECPATQIVQTEHRIRMGVSQQESIDLSEFGSRPYLQGHLEEGFAAVDENVLLVAQGDQSRRVSTTILLRFHVK